MKTELIQARQPLEDFGKELQRLRLSYGRNGMSRYQMAQILDIDPSRIRAIELGFRLPPKPSELRRWCRVMNKSYSVQKRMVRLARKRIREYAVKKWEKE